MQLILTHDIVDKFVPQVIKFTSCLPMVGGSLRVLRLLPPLKLVAMIQLKYHGQATGKLYHLWLRVECTLFCNLQSRARTHAILVIGLYELLGNQTT
jgi:hypothetical protein